MKLVWAAPIQVESNLEAGLIGSTRLAWIFAAALLVTGACTRPGAATDDHSAHITPTATQPVSHLIIEPPLPALLAKGLAVIKFRAENTRIVAVYGEAALSVVPRLGHLHVTVDGGTWHWLHASDEPIVIQGLTPGPHKVLVELADANHAVLDGGTIAFDVPGKSPVR